MVNLLETSVSKSLLRYGAWIAMAACSQGPKNDPPQPETTFTIEQLKDPETCKDCHPKQYQEWSGSMHAYATDDPLFVAMNKMGQEEAKIGPFCVKCHAPMAVHEGMNDGAVELDKLAK